MWDLSAQTRDWKAHKWKENWKVPPALEGQVLTTGPPGKPQKGVLSSYSEKAVSHELF